MWGIPHGYIHAHQRAHSQLHRHHHRASKKDTLPRLKAPCIGVETICSCTCRTSSLHLTRWELLLDALPNIGHNPIHIRHPTTMSVADCGGVSGLGDSRHRWITCTWGACPEVMVGFGVPRRRRVPLVRRDAVGDSYVIRAVVGGGSHIMWLRRRALAICSMRGVCTRRRPHHMCWCSGTLSCQASAIRWESRR
jgi:hypothetical protein